MDMTRIEGFRCFDAKLLVDTTATGVSDYIMIPPDIDRGTVQLTVLSTASVKVEGTASSAADVIAGTARWAVWPFGEITGGATVQNTLTGPLSAVRCNTMTAKAGLQATLEVKAQRGNP